MVVVVIIGILVAIAIPLYGAVQTRAADGSDEANARTLHGAAMMAVAGHGNPPSYQTWPSDTSWADWDEYIEGDDWPSVPEHATTSDDYVVTIDSDGNVSINRDF